MFPIPVFQKVGRREWLLQVSSIRIYEKVIIALLMAWPLSLCKHNKHVYPSLQPSRIAIFTAHFFPMYMCSRLSCKRLVEIASAP